MNILNRCLCCDSALTPLIDFGPQPLVNTYGVTDKFPLSVNRCVSCCHLQLNEFVDPAILYSDYSYQSGTGQTASEFFTGFAKNALSYFPTARTVLDIACNDGSQLDAFKALGMETYGIDPAINLSPISRIKGHYIRVGFLENTNYSGRTFDLITAQNVLGHTPAPLNFLEKCREIMHEQSHLFIATSQANMVVNGECDTIYSEHVSYFNAHSMMKLAERAGLVILDLILPDIHGTSYVFVMGKSGKPSQAVKDRLDWEFLTGMMSASLYAWWRTHVERKIKRINELIVDYMKHGFFAVGVSAAAKGLSMLNKARVKLDILVDNTPSKQGRFANGMLIVPFDEIANLNQNKVLFVILAWNLTSELKRNTVKLRNKASDVFIEIK